jgi:hypothetical protein
MANKADLRGNLLTLKIPGTDRYAIDDATDLESLAAIINYIHDNYRPISDIEAAIGANYPGAQLGDFWNVGQNQLRDHIRTSLNLPTTKGQE